MSAWFVPTPERIRAVTQEIADGSEPKFSYYLLLVTAAMIASFGLVTNSTAVIIGAMLVSPLMTPIFGIAQSMLRGDGALFARALRAEFGGVALAVFASFCFGLFPLLGDATPEMLARTQPQLLDLMVAVFAGFAGAYALVDERVSPALPGVAIATAIVPPLSTCGLCLATGAYAGAFGAFLLFFANFIAILLVSLVMFALGGMAPALNWISWRDAFHRFGPVLAGFTVIAVILTHSLVQITHERHIERTIREVLSRQLAQETIALDDYQYKQHADSIYVLATVRSPKVVPPRRVTELQELLATDLGCPTELIVRTMVAEDVAAFGSKAKADRVDFNGVFFSNAITAHERKRRVARQVLLERLESAEGFQLLDLEYGETESGAIAYATIQTIRPPQSDEIAEAEDLLKKRLEEPNLSLVIQCSVPSILSRDGPVLIEWTNYGKEGTEQPERLAEIRRSVEAEVRKIPDTSLVAVHLHIQKDRWRVLAEVVGPRPVTPAELSIVRDAVSKSVSLPVDLCLWHRADIVVTPEGYEAFNEFTRHTLEKRIESLPKTFGKVVSK